MNIEQEYLDKCALFINRLREDVFQTYQENAYDIVYDSLYENVLDKWYSMNETDQEHILDEDIIDTFSVITFCKNSDYLVRKHVRNREKFCYDLSSVCRCRNFIAHRNPDISYDFVCESIRQLYHVNQQLGFGDLVPFSSVRNVETCCNYHHRGVNALNQSRIRTMFLLLIEQIQLKYGHLNPDFFSYFQFDDIFNREFEDILLHSDFEIDFKSYCDLCCDKHEIMSVRNTVFHGREHEDVNFEWTKGWIVNMGLSLCIDIEHLLWEMYWHRNNPGYNVR